MKRRDFLKKIGTGAVTVCTTPKISLALNNPSAPSVLVEAQHFTNRGGWLLDSQFYDELGFCYLLAHGLGTPVENAHTTVEFPEPGTYHVWVRTKDWVPGDWDAPGRFELLVNGQSIGTEFGTESGWGWQSGGTVQVQKTKNRVELNDLTGFDGRCDAIYFSQNPGDVPPNQSDRLKTWRMHKRAISEDIETHQYDVVIAGGGLAGCGAALAANDMGIDVALIQDRPVLGGNASEEIRLHTLGIAGRAKEIINKINTPDYEPGSAKYKQPQKKRRKHMQDAENVDLFMKHSVYDALTDGNQITELQAVEIETGKRRRFKAPNFIDSTGDGWVGYWAGADFRYGRESKHEFGEEWEKYGDLWSPEEPDNRVMGSTLYWNSEETDQRVSFPDVPWAKPVAKDLKAIDNTWHWEFSHNDFDQIENAEDIRDHLFRATYGAFANAKKEPEHATRKLKWVGHVIGKRESRRLMGDHIFDMNDAIDCRLFDDRVVMEKRHVDVHYQRARKGSKYSFLADAMFRKPKKKYYYVPFRSLYSRNIDNLMMAGRCFSCSHVGLGGPRVMETCAQMGVAVGYASALCKTYDETPRGIYEHHMDELKELTGFSQLARRTSDGVHFYNELPDTLKKLHQVTIKRGSFEESAPGYAFRVNVPVTVYLSVHNRGDYQPDGWTETDMTAGGEHYQDTIYKRTFRPGTVNIPPHTGQEGTYYGLPHAAFIKVQEAEPSELTLKDLPEQLEARVDAPPAQDH